MAILKPGIQNKGMIERLNEGMSYSVGDWNKKASSKMQRDDKNYKFNFT